MSNLSAKLAPNKMLPTDSAFSEGSLVIELIGHIREHRPYLWIGDDKGNCFATLEPKTTKRFLIKSIAQIMPGARIVTK